MGESASNASSGRWIYHRHGENELAIDVEQIVAYGPREEAGKGTARASHGLFWLRGGATFVAPEPMAEEIRRAIRERAL
jgi:hypothetical protein